MEKSNIQHRGLPLTVKLGCSFLGPIGLVGWFFFSFATACLPLMLPKIDLMAWRDFSGNVVRTNGTVIKDTDASGRKSTSSRNCKYEFSDQNGVRHSGISYCDNGSSTSGEISVEYPAGQPEKSRVCGMRRKPFTPWMLTVLVFPVAGIALIILQFTVGVKQARLLSSGIVTLGVMVDKYMTQSTDSDGHRSTTWNCKFEFITNDGMKRCVSASSQYERTYSGETLTAAQKLLAERILADGAGSSLCPYILVDGVRYIDDDSRESQLQQATNSILKVLRKLIAGSPNRDKEELRATRAKLAANPVIEPLIYNPVDPLDAMMLDEFPGGPRLSPDKKIVLKKGWHIFLAMLIPLAGITICTLSFSFANWNAY